MDLADFSGRQAIGHARNDLQRPGIGFEQPIDVGQLLGGGQDPLRIGLLIGLVTGPASLVRIISAHKQPLLEPRTPPMVVADTAHDTRQKRKNGYVWRPGARAVENACDRLNELPIGVMHFPGTGIQDNLADKAKKLGIPVWRFGGA